VNHNGCHEITTSDAGKGVVRYMRGEVSDKASLFRHSLRNSAPEAVRGPILP
jgi:hypothetical protein